MKIAIFTKNWLGDVIFQIPAMRAIKKKFPGSELLVVCPKRCVEILQACPFVSEVIPFDDRARDKNLLAFFKLIWKLRSRRIGRFYLFHRSFSRAVIAWFSGSPVRIGYASKNRGFLLTQAIPEPEQKLHSVRYYLELVRRSGTAIDEEYQCEFYFTPQDRRRAERLIREVGFDPSRLVAINPGANWPPKRWPVDHFADLAYQLAEQFGVQVIVTGGPSDETLGNVIANKRKHPFIKNLCGQTTICELGALFSFCRLLISSDSGPLHIGAGVGTNVVAIFGPTDPKQTGPLGRGKNVVLHHIPEGERVPWYGENFPYGKWMEHISVEQVMNVIEKEGLLEKVGENGSIR
ncbi:MAG: lipopolysaccharide heptosyltransferase II [Omnitrophica bacterium RIFCSPLOWO2_12_FULL_44_17]|uniref:lipopolysaccharide heptosyltransferase II n=1 Tax=Candidatus Danuiimicrobium aquiferis TaxID=1801832 RepID=A0A1G1L1Z2_9BACT|nr:MAG: lipopolysaccharide heptosyltransferase II [Omnitrophica bacterium RIFCSPHIGHO2_02_FULL_45_28]OGW91301.1 MAG: lipopolysaccharide heptosyltransferase II [Omnitrophica bacterium RIFCSPHIGHO2_12_FULL_44_12]OGW99167.1 MAG: lipopolysaccharide heptosyltransferase II [Omnitrophica bacterium RIFCSPLOWO2_12_FULL_44_17]OGX04416.1 MAG: lipopolysaccharide heptosyltransferase II [Omnitrophica bacterium RIFCSPLOWO2_02_FULL_44_11]